MKRPSSSLFQKLLGADREILFEELDGVPNVVPILDRGEWKNFWVLVTGEPSGPMAMTWLLRSGTCLVPSGSKSVTWTKS